MTCQESDDLSIFKLLSVDDSYPDSKSFDGLDDEDIGNPFLTDRFGNLTNWRLNDLEAAYENHLEDEASKPSIEKKKYSKEEKIKLDNDCKEQYMKSALQKYNSEENLDGECFVFDEIKEVVFIVEGGLDFYEHYNFTAKQGGSTILFFAEVIPDDGETCDVLCCKPLDCNDKGPCFGCKNQGSVSLRHPTGEGLYVGCHVDCEFPFMWDSISEDSD
ncbi:uncharacterized protein LOC100835119 isoform X2 [Brachypodium distachyon]|uniref:uncharacterized protein LOC100835119 isoform X2 n=1 Tax=Brachypodium distachyon TaxID=15368 RepID=UPI0006E46F7F|nr:uncharacterized protein LOC100835119 isoform X2 [Brachypodium distachyon]|eukprot:XP_024316712.1 uncharacterized protein LOC100835119 isoform X2 [Brachypodium distachyon]